MPKARAAAVVLGFFLLAPAAPQAAAGDKPPKTMVFSVPSDPKTFNEMVAQETTSSAVTQFLFQGLTRYNPATGEVLPLLAERWSVSADGLVWTFDLRQDVKWSDGEPFTAEDVLFTFKDLIYNPKIVTPARDIFTLQGKPIEVRQEGPYRIVFTLPVPFAPFLLALNQAIMPKHALAPSVTDGTFSSAWGTDENPDHIVGTGPYRLKRYVSGERIELVRNPFYWRKDSQGQALPRVDRIMLVVVPSAEGRLLKFLQGETDAYGVTGDDYPVLKEKEKQGRFILYKTGPGFGSNFVVFNQNAKDPAKKRWFQNKKFRQAMAHSLDRPSMIDIIYNRLGALQCSPESPSTPVFYNPAVKCYDYDPQAALSLLKEEGFEDRNKDSILEDAEGTPLEFVLLTNADNPERLKIAQMIREDIARLGIQVHLLALDFNALVSKLMVTQDWDAVLIGLTGAPDPHFGANVWRTTGSLHFWESKENPPPSQQRIDTIFEQASGILDKDARKKLYDEWQEIAAEELPHIYTVLPEVIYAVNSRLMNIKASALEGPFYEIDEIDVAERPA